MTVVMGDMAGSKPSDTTLAGEKASFITYDIPIFRIEYGSSTMAEYPE